MKRYRDRQPPEDDTGINLTPMIDIVFIMLIFFIVTASFIKESGITVDRPIAQTTTVQEHAAILVAINSDGEVWINRRRVDIRAVRANIERLHLDNPQGAVVIQADQRSDNGVFVEVLDQVRLAGVEKIAIAADPQ